MTSVQSLQPLLSGSKIWLFLIVIWVGTQAATCAGGGGLGKGKDKDIDGTEATTKGPQYPKETEPKTIEWNNGNNSHTPIPKIEEEVKGTSNESEIRTVYRVAMFMPFLADRYNGVGQVPSKSMRAVHFLEGAQMAMDQLGKEGVNMLIHIEDTKGDPSTMEYLLRSSDAKMADMLIGGVTTKNVTAIAEYAQKEQKPYVSPYNPIVGLTKNNPYYIQVNPSLQTHFVNIQDHIMANYKNSRIVLVGRSTKSETDRIRQIQNLGISRAGTVEEYVIPSNATYDEIDFTSYFSGGERNVVFIIPSWSNQTFIGSVLGKIRIADARGKAVVYGMPKWLDYTTIPYDNFQALNVHFSTEAFVNKTLFESKAFKTDFFARYGTAPTMDAFKGYDMMLYFGRMLGAHGTRFDQYLTENPHKGMHTNFKFKSQGSVKKVDDRFISSDRYENGEVNLVRYKNFQLQLVEK